ncbi:4Fe-4S binding protein [Desulfovibrio inopinatus]|uniref:4Fe-4S binding protein n=1 Tax=Desulfovibrio inopinatus TaxID=102109 RepID=UPI000409E999|nr:4Fe-4S binding protein [Desulfovibrio inopinatus]
MPIVIRVLVSFASLLLAAHALRMGNLGLFGAILWCTALLYTRYAWARLVLMCIMVAGAINWLLVGHDLILFRHMANAPWVRLCFIMTTVLALTVSALAVLATPTAKTLFPRQNEAARAQAGAFVLTIALLEAVRSMAPFPLLLVDRFFPGWGQLEIIFLATYAAWVAGRLLNRTTARQTRRYTWALFSTAFFAQLFLGLAGISRMLMTGTLHLPVPALILAGPIYRGQGYFMLILFSASVLILGPAWCSRLCYIGAWDDISCRRMMPGKMGLGGRPVAWRTVTLVFTVGMAAFFGWKQASPTVAVSVAAGFGLIGLAFMAASSRNGHMLHCTLWCPMGLIANIWGKLSPWRIIISQDCTACGACSRVCRYDALTALDLERKKPGLACTLCGDCIGVCNKNHIGYGIYNRSSRKAEHVFLALAAGLHAVFLGVARI